MSTDDIMKLAEEYAIKMAGVANYVRSNAHHEARSALLKAVEALEKDAARYRFIRNGGAYIEPQEYESGGKIVKEMYMATETGKYYADLRDFDMDLDAAMQKEAP